MLGFLFQSSQDVELTPSGYSGDHGWEREPSWDERSTYYPEHWIMDNDMREMLEGGRIRYAGLKICGTRDNAYQVASAVELLRTDSEGRDLVDRCGKIILAVRMEWLGWHKGSGWIAVSVNRPTRQIASSIYHELLHADGYGVSSHTWIEEQQDKLLSRI